jgi:hypothetical protein
MSSGGWNESSGGAKKESMGGKKDRGGAGIPRKPRNDTLKKDQRQPQDQRKDQRKISCESKINGNATTINWYINAEKRSKCVVLRQRSACLVHLRRVEWLGFGAIIEVFASRINLLDNRWKVCWYYLVNDCAGSLRIA